jgi:hypothetical protein
MRLEDVQDSEKWESGNIRVKGECKTGSVLYI